jgi:NTE family protein
MIAIMVRQGTLASRARLTARDVLIEPDLGRMTTFDFAKVPQAMAAGQSATQAAAARLAPLALDEQGYARYVAARKRPQAEDVQVAFVRPDPRSTPDADRIEAVFGGLAGAPLDRAELERRLYLQYGLDLYESTDYQLVRGDGEQGLEIDLRRKSWGPNFLRLGLSVEQDYEGGAVGNAAVRLLMTGLNSRGAEWLTDVQLGEEPRFYTEFFQPLAFTNGIFIAPSFRYELETLQAVEDGQRIARYRIRDTEFALAAGAELSNWGELRFGVRTGDGSTRVLIGDPGLPEGDFDIGGVFVNFGYDRLDSAYFPRHGQALRASWLADRESLGASRDADIVAASWQFARSLNRYSMVLSLDGGSALDDRVNSPQDLFTLGGFFNISGLPTDTLAGTQYGIARGMFYRRISRGGTGFFEFPAYLGVTVEAGNAWLTRDDVDFGNLETGGSLFLGAESPFGPVYLAAGLAEGGRKAFYLFLGKTF